MTLGQTDGGGPDVFGSISGLEEDAAGRLYVLDGQAQEIRVFEPDGTYAMTIGRRGEGPGEFRGAGGLNLDSSGNVWVWDPNNVRFTAFSPDGTVIRSIRRQVAGVVFPWRGELAGDNHLIDWGLAFPEMQPSGLDMGTLTVFYPVSVDLADGTVDTFPPLTYRVASVHENRVPFRRTLTFHVSMSGQLWLAHTGTYTLYRTTLSGDTTLIVSRTDADPMVVTAAERDSVLAIPDPLAGVPGREPLHGDWIPSTKPVIARVITDDESHLFVFSRLNGQEAGTTVDVFDATTGEYFGPIALPVQFEMNPLPIAVRGTLVGVTRGEYDVPRVVRIDLQQPER